MGDKVKVVLDVRCSENSDFSEGFRDLFSIFDSSSNNVQSNGVLRIFSTNSAAVPLGDVAKARYVYLRGKTNSRLVLSGVGSFPMRARPNSAWAFFIGKTSVTALRVVHSSTASGRFPYFISGVEA